MGNKGEEDSEETSENVESSKQESEPETSVEKPESLDHVPVAEGKEVVETDRRDNVEAEEITVQEENKVHETEEDGEHVEPVDGTTVQDLDHGKDEQQQLPEMPVELPESPIQKSENSDSISNSQEKEIAEVGTLESPVMTQQPMVSNFGDDVVEGSTSELGEPRGTSDVHDTTEVETEEESKEEERVHTEENVERISSVQPETSDDTEKRDDTDTSVLHSVASEESNSTDQPYNELQSIATPNESSEVVSDLVSHDNETIVEENERDHLANNIETDIKEQHLGSTQNMHDLDSKLELERVKREMKMMEAALQGAARQAQVFHKLYIIFKEIKLLSAHSFLLQVSRWKEYCSKWPDWKKM